MSLKNLVGGGLIAVAVLSSSIAGAATVTISNSVAVPPYDNILTPLPGNFSGTQGIQTGDSSGQYVSPWDGTSYQNNPYYSLQIGSTATYFASQFGPGFTANVLSLFWGSPDDYNSISFYNAGGTALATVTGLDLTPPSPHTGHDLVNITLDTLWTYFTMSTTHQAFEFTNLAAFCDGDSCGPGGGIPSTPLPSAVVLFGTALAGVGLLGSRRRRRILA